jgi:hypothetical protein
VGSNPTLSARSKTNMTAPNQNSISWQAPEFRHYPKNLGWYITLIAITILVDAFFIIVESDIFAAVSLSIIAALFIVFARQTPQTVTITLNSKGVDFGNLFYPYKQIKYFWVVNNQNHKTVNFHTSAFVNNILILELENQEPDRVRDFLIKHLPEHSETEETSAQRMMHRFKF